MLTKIFTAGALAMSMFMGGQLMDANIADAKDVYIGDFGMAHYYMMDETIDIQNDDSYSFMFYVKVKACYNDDFEYVEYKFCSWDGKYAPLNKWDYLQGEGAKSGTHFGTKVGGAAKVVLNGCLKYLR